MALSFLKTRAIKYCQWTSLHGFNFLVYPGQTWSQIIFWIAIVVTSLAGASFLVFNNVADFAASTVTYDLVTQTHPLSDVIFPSLAICNMNQLRSSFIWSLIKDPSLNDIPYMHVHQLLEKTFIRVSSAGAGLILVETKKLKLIPLSSGPRSGTN